MIALSAALLANESFAQRVTNTAPNQPRANLQIMGNVSSSIQLSIVGSGNTQLSNATNTINSPASARVNFGAFGTINPSFAQGDAYRINNGTDRGAVVAARLIATLTYQGAATGSILVTRSAPAGGPPNIPAPDLRLAAPAINWTTRSHGFAVPNPASAPLSLCVIAGNTTCLNGVGYEHHIALYIPDNRPAGPFSTSVVYTAVVP